VKSEEELSECLLHNKEFALGIDDIEFGSRYGCITDQHMTLLSNALKRSSSRLSTLSVRGQSLIDSFESLV